MSRDRERGPVAASSLLEREFARLFGDLGDVMRVWREVVGPDVSCHAVPVSLTRDVLRVSCTSGVWASEVQQLSHELLTRLSGQLGEAAPRRIQCVVAPLAGRTEPPA